MALTGLGRMTGKAAGKAMSQNTTAISVQQTPIGIPDGEWDVLIQYDDEIKAAVEKLKPLGQPALNKFRQTYGVLKDKSKIEKIVADIAASPPKEPDPYLG